LLTPPRAIGQNAVDADQRPLEFQVIVDGISPHVQGKSAENLERVILYNMEEVGIKPRCKVTPIPPSPRARIATRIVSRRTFPRDILRNSSQPQLL